MVVLGLSRETESIGYIFIKREIYFKELASGIGKFKICRVDQQIETQEGLQRVPKLSSVTPSCLGDVNLFSMKTFK